MIGCAFIVRGNIADNEGRYTIIEEKTALQIKYFHITEKGKGYGKNWLKEIIIPYYSELEYKRIYVNSSHPLSFAFYERLGERIANYTQRHFVHSLTRRPTFGGSSGLFPHSKWIQQSSQLRWKIHGRSIHWAISRNKRWCSRNLVFSPIFV